jgi:hypothetical protein
VPTAAQGHELRRRDALQGLEGVQDTCVSYMTWSGPWRAWRGQSLRLQAGHEDSEGPLSLEELVLWPGILSAQSQMGPFPKSFGF